MAEAFGKHLALHQKEWLPKKDTAVADRQRKQFKLPTDTWRIFMDQLVWSKALVSKPHIPAEAGQTMVPLVADRDRWEQD